MKYRLFRDQWYAIGIIYVVPILAGIMAVVGTSANGYLQKARIERTENEIIQISIRVNQFKRDCGFYPSASQGLDALFAKPSAEPLCANWKGPYTQSNFKDAWGTPYIYSVTGDKFSIKSLGRDKQEGGTGFDKDISSEELR
jgi:general secretion pathway protein G